MMIDKARKKKDGKKYSTTREGKTRSTWWDDGKNNTYNYWYGYSVVVNCTSFNISSCHKFLCHQNTTTIIITLILSWLLQIYQDKICFHVSNEATIVMIRAMIPTIPTIVVVANFLQYQYFCCTTRDGS